MNINKTIRQKENRKLAFKEKLSSNDKIIKTAIAFSNSQGGDLIIGIDTENKVIGIDENLVIKYEETISNTIYDNCYPSIIPEIVSVNIKGKMLLIAHFYPSNSKPHYVKQLGKYKGTFIRVGSSNRLANIQILEELERQRNRISFDSVVNYEIKYKEDVFLILTFI